MDWTIAAIVGLAALTVTVGGIVWRLAQTLAELTQATKVMLSDMRRLAEDMVKLEGRLMGEFDKLETGTGKAAEDLRRDTIKSASELRHDTSGQIKELTKLVSESSVSKDHLLLQLQTLELRVLNGLLERVIKLLRNEPSK